MVDKQRESGRVEQLIADALDKLAHYLDDKFVKVKKVPKVDYIKMDVEGHELKVLKGAAETIQTYKPRLALSVYHRGNDLVELPKFLLALNPNYRFYLRHCTPIWADTVLYAISVDN